MIDVGGTTTDVGSVRDSQLDVDRRGSIKGVPISFPMSNVHSTGVGGSSDHRGHATARSPSARRASAPRRARPASASAASSATITDVNLLLGVLDPTPTSTAASAWTPSAHARSSPRRRRTAGDQPGGGPDPDGGGLLRTHGGVVRGRLDDPDDTTIAAFGGAGPMSACGAARLTGVRACWCPKLAAVFSAFGISFSDIGQTYEAGLRECTSEAARSVTTRCWNAPSGTCSRRATSSRTAPWSGPWSRKTDGTLVSEIPYAYGDAPARRQRAWIAQAHRHRTAAAPGSRRRRVAHAAGRPSPPARARCARAPAGSTRSRSTALADQEPGATRAGPGHRRGPVLHRPRAGRLVFDVTAGGDLLLTDTH